MNRVYYTVLCCAVLCYVIILCCAVMWCAVLCYVIILCCAVLCCAVLCCVVLCCAVLCNAVLCHVVILCCAVLCYVIILYCAVLCCAVLCCVMLLYCAVLCCAVLCCAVLCCVVFFNLHSTSLCTLLYCIISTVLQKLITSHILSRGLCLVLVPAALYLLQFFILFAVLFKTGPHDDMMSSAFQASLKVHRNIYFTFYFFTSPLYNSRPLTYDLHFVGCNACFVV